MSSDEALTRLFFYGIGAPLLREVQATDPAEYETLGPYVVELNHTKT